MSNRKLLAQFPFPFLLSIEEVSELLFSSLWQLHADYADISGRNDVSRRSR